MRTQIIARQEVVLWRRIKTEGKAKVAVSVCRAAVLTRAIWKIGWIHPFLSNHPGANHPIIKIVQCKTDSAARNWINSSPQTEGTTFAFSSVCILLLWWQTSLAQCTSQVSLLTCKKHTLRNAPPVPWEHRRKNISS